MKILLIISLSLTCWVNNFATSASTDIRKSMVHFDQAFLPVYLHVHDGNMVEAKRAVFYLEFQWQQMRNQHEFSNLDAQWRHSFAKINDYLGNAYFAIDSNNPTLAMKHLESTKSELIDLRERYHISYYLDYLFDFQESTEQMSAIADDEMLNLLGWGELEDLTQATADAWRDASYQPMDATLYELSIEDLIQLRHNMQQVTLILDEVQSAMDKANREDVAKTCKKIAPAFRKVLVHFGNFDAAAMHYAQRDDKTQQHIYSRFQN